MIWCIWKVIPGGQTPPRGILPARSLRPRFQHANATFHVKIQLVPMTGVDEMGRNGCASLEQSVQRGPWSGARCPTGRQGRTEDSGRVPRAAADHRGTLPGAGGVAGAPGIEPMAPALTHVDRRLSPRPIAIVGDRRGRSRSAIRRSPDAHALSRSHHAVRRSRLAPRPRRRAGGLTTPRAPASVAPCCASSSCAVVAPPDAARAT